MEVSPTPEMFDAMALAVALPFVPVAIASALPAVASLAGFGLFLLF